MSKPVVITKDKEQAVDTYDDDYYYYAGYKNQSFETNDLKPKEVFSSGLTYSETINVMIHEDLLNVCQQLFKKFDGNEFSILTKGYMHENMFYTTDAFVIPKQKVGHAHVDYDQAILSELKHQGYNTVIHSHPIGCSWFSQSDYDTINVHFQCSILYHNGAFAGAIMPIQVSNEFVLQVRAKTAVYKEKAVEINETELSNIEVEKYTPVTYGGAWDGGKYNKYGSQYGKDADIKKGSPGRIRVSRGGKLYEVDVDSYNLGAWWLRPDTFELIDEYDCDDEDYLDDYWYGKQYGAKKIDKRDAYNDPYYFDSGHC